MGMPISNDKREAIIKQMEEGKTNVDEWIKRLPKGYEEACVRTKAWVRKREIKTPSDLMKLVLMY